MVRRTLLMLTLALLAVACGDAQRERWGAWPSADERRFREGYAPAPYTPAQIRDACPEGRRSTFLIQSPGSAPSHQTFEFSKVTDKGCQVTVRTRGPEGVAMPPRTNKATWVGLQSHASYPEKATRISRDTIETPAGRFHCMLYTVANPNEKAAVTKTWFAHELPGPPVLIEQRKGDLLLLRMVLVEHEIARAGTGTPDTK